MRDLGKEPPAIFLTCSHHHHLIAIGHMHWTICTVRFYYIGSGLCDTSPSFWQNGLNWNGTLSVFKNENIIAHIFNTFFVNITLDLTPWEICLNMDTNTDDIELIVEKYCNHPSINFISRSYTSKLCCFKNVTLDQVQNVLLDLDPKKSVSGPFSSKVVQMVADIISLPISQCLNFAIKSSKFPQSLKFADVSTIFKKGDKFLKENYRPISILPSTSKTLKGFCSLIRLIILQTFYIYIYVVLDLNTMLHFIWLVSGINV